MQSRPLGRLAIAVALVLLGLATPWELAAEDTAPSPSPSLGHPSEQDGLGCRWRCPDYVPKCLPVLFPPRLCLPGPCYQGKCAPKIKYPRLCPPGPCYRPKCLPPLRPPCRFPSWYRCPGPGA